MLNVFKVKKISGLVLMGVLPALFFYISLIFYGLLISIGVLLIMVLILYFLTNLLLKNPFTAMIEGAGILAINMDSTGVLNPFIISLEAPYIRGKLKGKEINDVWDREATFSIAAPKVAGTAKKVEKKGKEFFNITLNEEDYNKGRFALYHYPVIIWNEQTKSLLTKDFFAEKEKNAFAEHGVLYLNRKMEELTSAMLNFGRYVIEQLKPKTEWYKNKWVMIIVIVFLVILIALFLPPVINSIKGAASGGGLGGLTGAINPN